MNTTAAVSALAVLLAGCATTRERSAPVTTVERPAAEPLACIAGADSAIRKVSYFRITTAEDWMRLRKQHLGDKYDYNFGPAFDVDFSRCMVVAVFAGSRQNTRGIEVASLHESADATLIRFDVLGYQTVTGLSTNLGQAATQKVGADIEINPPHTPFAFILLSKSSRTILLEENKQNLIEGPPKWTEVARLPGRSAAK